MIRKEPGIIRIMAEIIGWVVVILWAIHVIGSL